MEIPLRTAYNVTTLETTISPSTLPRPVCSARAMKSSSALPQCATLVIPAVPPVLWSSQVAPVALSVSSTTALASLPVPPSFTETALARNAFLVMPLARLARDLWALNAHLAPTTLKGQSSSTSQPAIPARLLVPADSM